MKINNAPTPPPRPETPNKPAARPDGAPADGAHRSDAAGDLQPRDFASVLDELTRPPEKERQGESRDAERRDAEDPTRARAERDAGRRDERRGGDEGGSNPSSQGGGFHAPGEVREGGWRGEAVGARAVLHIADLEKLVSAVRTQIHADGRREVTLVLHRSVLDGLRVKLSADATGRINAEFIASTERVRAQVDARSAELADLLRSRGIALAELRTSVGTGTDQDASGGSGGRGPFEVAALPETDARPASRTSAAEPAAGPDEAGLDEGSTYRA